MGRTPQPTKEPLERLVVMIDGDTKDRVRKAAEKPKYKGNMSQYALEALLEKLERE